MRPQIRSALRLSEFEPGTVSREAFIARFGGVYEHAPWVAEAAFDAGVDNEDALVDAMARKLAAIVDAAGEERQTALLRAHPELAGKLALAGGLTAESQSEQASAGLDACTPEEFEAFGRLNARYQETFGFPFIIAVRGLHRTEILAALAARVENDRATEFQTALTQVHRIARLRLEQMAA